MKLPLRVCATLMPHRDYRAFLPPGKGGAPPHSLLLYDHLNYTSHLAMCPCLNLELYMYYSALLAEEEEGLGMLAASPVLHRKALASKLLHNLSCNRILEGEADLQKTTIFYICGFKNV